MVQLPRLQGQQDGTATHLPLITAQSLPLPPISNQVNTCSVRSFVLSSLSDFDGDVKLRRPPLLGQAMDHSENNPTGGRRSSHCQPHASVLGQLSPIVPTWFLVCPYITNSQAPRQ